MAPTGRGIGPAPLDVAADATDAAASAAGAGFASGARAMEDQGAQDLIVRGCRWGVVGRHVGHLLDSPIRDLLFEAETYCQLNCCRCQDFILTGAVISSFDYILTAFHKLLLVRVTPRLNGRKQFNESSRPLEPNNLVHEIPK